MATPTRSNLPSEAPASITQLVQWVLISHQKGVPFHSIARRVETYCHLQVNERLSLLASAILSYAGLEESVAVRAAVSRGSVEQVVINTAYEARKAFAELTRSMRTEVNLANGRPRKTQRREEKTCNEQSDAVETPAVPGGVTSGEAEGSEESEENDSLWWASLGCEPPS